MKMPHACYTIGCNALLKQYNRCQEIANNSELLSEKLWLQLQRPIEVQILQISRLMRELGLNFP